MGVDKQWAIPAGIFIALQLVGAIALSRYLGFTGEPPFHAYAILYGRAIALVAVFVVLLAFGHALLARARSPIGHMIGWLAGYRHLMPSLIVGVGLCWCQLVLLTWYKSLIPLSGPMWADPMLADWDAMLVGFDPGPAMQAPLAPFRGFIDFLYMMWAPILKLLFLGLLLTAPSRQRSQLILAFFLIIGLLGAWGQYLLPSGGPIYWQLLGYGDRFAAIIPPPLVEQGRDILWTKYQHQTMGFASGISAFPSIHVASSAWMVLVSLFLFKRTRAVLIGYFVVIAIGSVYTGWHYALDGIAGAAGAVACYYLARSIVGFMSRQSAKETQTSPIPA